MLRPNGTPADKKSDVFSFGMVMFEVGGDFVLEIPVTLWVCSGFLWDCPVPNHHSSGGAGNYHVWRTAEPTYQPLFK